MPSRTVSDRDLVERLGALFRTTGFDGATLSQIATATGLQKSSLYHRFPDGKQQMAAEAAGDVAQEFATDVLAPLGSDRPVRERVEEVGRRLRTFYERGARNCLLDVLSVGDPGAAASSALAAAAAGWTKAFARIASEAGADGATATARAQDAIASIEGALVLARVTGDRRPFSRAIERLPDVLAPEAGR